MANEAKLSEEVEEALDALFVAHGPQPGDEDDCHHFAELRAAIRRYGEQATGEARAIVEDLVNQFAYEADGPALHDGGLSALEDAFAFLGWESPHPAPWRGCDEPGCIKHSTCGWPSPTGYRRTCGDHAERS